MKQRQFLKLDSSLLRCAVMSISITIYNESLERLEAMIDGFKIGITMTYENLVIHLDTLSKQSK